MATHSSITELQNMQTADLVREIHGKRMNIAKMRLGLTMGSEKDSALFRRERKELAQMLTVLRTKEGKPGSTMAAESPKKAKAPLKTKAKNARVAAPNSQ
jgi:ribosomal protein L29